MQKKSRYVFSAALAGVALGGASDLVSSAKAAVLADFTFETSQPVASAASIGPLSAEIGTGSAFGLHASSSTVYSTPAGNGSAHSFSSTVWAVGDYYEFDVPTSGYQDILVSFDQTSSSTGPKGFTFEYSIDGTNFSTVGSYAPIVNAAGTTGTLTVSAWNSGTSQPAFNFAFDLSSVTGLADDATAKFRIVDTSAPASSGGTDRVDNVVVSGTPVPEPAELSLLTVAAAGLLFRRRNSK